MTIQGSLKSESFKQWELAQLDRHETLVFNDIPQGKLDYP